MIYIFENSIETVSLDYRLTCPIYMQVYYKVMVLTKYFDFSKFLHSTHFNYPHLNYSTRDWDEVSRLDDCSIVFDNFKDCY